jgi:hypothetical protein
MQERFVTIILNRLGGENSIGIKSMLVWMWGAGGLGKVTLRTCYSHY